MKTIRTYSELITIANFEDRYNYLKLDGRVGMDTFGFDRFMNQQFYKSKEWRRIRDIVIIRDTIGDYCCDLGIEGHDIHGRILIHHMNPLSPDDIKFSSDYLLNPDYLIATTHNTHEAIHYGDASLLVQAPIERTENDMCPWRH